MNRNIVFARFARASFLSALTAILLFPVMGRSAEVVINELIAANSTVAPLAELPEYFPDYLELYNTTSTNIDLGDGRWSLSVKKNPQAFPFDYKDFFFFPTNSVIPAGGYLLVFFDDKTNNPGIHTSFTVGGTNESFTLKASGDEVLLFKDLNTSFPNVPIPEDSVSFGFQVENYSIGRIPDGTGEFTLNIPTPCGSTRPCTNNIAASFLPSPSSTNELTLKINEWLAFNLSGSGKTNTDWFEIFNPDTNIVSMGGLVFVDQGYDAGDLLKEENQMPPLSFIAPLGFVQILADSVGDEADSVDFSLSSTSGDDIYMFASDRSTLVDYVNLPIFATPNVSRGRVPDGSTNIIELPNLSPGAKNIRPITDIVISEVLAHTDIPLEDAIELQNVSSNSVDISHWWLSNDRDVPMKFQIPEGTVLPPGGLVVFYEGIGASSGFNRDGSGDTPYFTLNSARGDEVYLFKANPDGSLTGDQRGIDFGPSQNGVSFGRYTTSATNGGSSDIVAMSARTFGNDNPTSVSQFRLGLGLTNAYPKVGPIVISEIHYHPPDIETNDNSLDEFIEIRNHSDNTVLLYDPLFPTNQWRLKDAVSFTFPTNQSLAPDEFALIVNFDPTNLVQLAAFKVVFPNIPESTKIFGPYGGKLDNGGATVEIAWPDQPQALGRVDAGLVPYIVMDRVKYKDSAPWPVGADGTGESMQRIVMDDYGDDSINWKGATPTPGQFNNSIGLEPPRITVQPQSQTIDALQITSLSVTARGGDRSYQWLFNGTNLVDATNATLQFIGITTEQAGPYQVVLTNAAGSVTSIIATLTVRPTAPDTSRPNVTISSPKNGQRVTDSSITVFGNASDKVALYRVEFRVGDGPWLEAEGTTIWGRYEVPLEPGLNIITARAIDTSLNVSPEKTVGVFYVVTSELTLSTTGAGSVSGATSGDDLEIGRSYTLTAKPDSGHVFSNWTGGLSSSSPKLDFLMESNLTLTANFVPNPFSSVAGVYSGLFYDTNGVEHGSSGFFTLKLSDRGTYSAKILGGGYKFSASGQFDLDGRSTNNPVVRRGANNLAILWNVDLAGSDIITGTVSDGEWVADLNGDRAIFSKTNPSTNVGKYTFTLPGLPNDAFVPGGSSYGTVAVDTKGNIKLKAVLADKTKATQKVPLSKNGQWPLYVSLYKNQGSLLSWIAFTNRASDDFNGLVNWNKPVDARAKYYQQGFTTNMVMMAGSLYTKPDRDVKIMELTDALLNFQGGNLREDASVAVTVVPGSKAVPVEALPKLKLGFTLSSGLFKGSYTPTNEGAKSVKFAGAVLQKNTNAAGHFLGTDQSGSVSLQAAP